ncbi:hypothetical protein WMY93_015604 [Mugilogobius chulae]|uniref:UPAR/Ly6 domain-containing protein n=1 Tax=Mugilogobius chulae TaxID=88201 RepID=A0AAW0NRP3_9GOBI
MAKRSRVRRPGAFYVEFAYSPSLEVHLQLIHSDRDRNMNRIILQLLVVTVYFAAVHTLKCYHCMGLFGICFKTRHSCVEGEHCFKGVATYEKLDTGFKFTAKPMGCFRATDCNQTFTETNKTHKITLTTTCCDTELCNSAPVSLPETLQLALASVSAVFGAKALV